MLPLNRRRCFREKDRALVFALAEAALPAGRVFPAADRGVVERVEQFVAHLPRTLQRAYRGLLVAVDASALLSFGRRFGSLTAHQRLAVLESLQQAGVTRRLSVRALMAPIKVAHFDNPEFFHSIGCVYDFGPVAAEAKPRYMRERVHAGPELEQDADLECDAVVIGSGAGGAVVAKELAERGHAVILLEEGAFYDRTHFRWRPFEAQRQMYRNAGVTFSLGNVGIPIPIGRTVGGTTTINSGTCYRAPPRVLRKWRESFGLHEFTDAAMERYYDRVEQILAVKEAQREYLGGVARVIARGCDQLGYRHRPLRRNAPDCDGKGVCCFGCPTDAKRSTNVSYVPLALKAGAELFHGAEVVRIVTEGGRATGVVARAVTPSGDPTGRQIKVRARAVIVACGALITPVLLQKNGLADPAGQLGQHLSIHPAVASLAVFDEEICAGNAIPQGYAIEEFHDEGLLFEGASTPLDIGMAAVPFLGAKLIDLAERFARVAMFGFMVEDSSRGRVRHIRGRTVITYVLNDRDVARIKRGHEILARVYFAAGAKKVMPLAYGFDEIESLADLERFRRANLRARDFDITAYHPLGTARMGRNPATSVVAPTHETHHVKRLYITDGSAVPSSPAVNPQVTIMALATRAAEEIDRQLSDSGS